MKFSKENIQNSVITTSILAVPRKKGASALTAELLTGSSKVKRNKYVFELRPLTKYWTEKKQIK